jgi:hypothetical protein
MTYGCRPHQKFIRLDRTGGLFRRPVVVRCLAPERDAYTLIKNFSDQMAGGPRLPVTNEIMMKITAITSST